MAARAMEKNLLIFQGLDWSIPPAEHGTVFTHPGANELSTLQQFGQSYDGVLAAPLGGGPASP